MRMKTERLVILSQFHFNFISWHAWISFWNSTSNLRLTKPTISDHSDCASSSQSRRREASSKVAIGTILTCAEGHMTLPTWFPGLFPSRPFHFVWEKALGTRLLTFPLWLFFKRRHYLDDMFVWAFWKKGTVFDPKKTVTIATYTPPLIPV